MNRWWLQAEILFARMGVAKTAIGLLLLASVMSWLFALPHYRSLDLRMQERITALNGENAPDHKLPRHENDDQRLDNLLSAMGTLDEVDQYLKVLFSIADTQNVALNKGEYRITQQPHSLFLRYQVTLPIVGSTARIQEFCRKMLEQFRFAALDELSFKRESIGAPVAEAKIQLSFYLKAKPTQGDTLAKVQLETVSP